MNTESKNPLVATINILAIAISKLGFVKAII